MKKFFRNLEKKILRWALDDCIKAFQKKSKCFYCGAKAEYLNIYNGVEYCGNCLRNNLNTSEEIRLKEI